MTVGARVRRELARRAPRLEETAVRINWRRLNRSRAFSADDVEDETARALIAALRREGFVISRFDEVLEDAPLFDEAAARARALAAAHPRGEEQTAGGSKASFLTKLASGSFAANDPFVRIALHPRVLQVANGYLGLRSTLRALELWRTRPTPGDPVQTQLWHRDADDVVNLKLFVYFTDVTRPAGPLTYAPRTHPLGNRRRVPPHDGDHRSTDEQMAAVVPRDQWRVLAGPPATVVFADTCGYHKQLKPTGEERIKLVAQYVSGAPYVPRALELSAVDPAALSEDQHYAVFDRAAS